MMRLHHLALVVPNLDDAVRFYSAAMDYEVVFAGAWPNGTSLMDELLGLESSAARTTLLSGPCGFLELFAFSAPDAPAATPLPPHHLGLRHFGIECEDPAAMAARVAAAGGTQVGEIIAIPGGAPAVVYCRDPFGNIVEFLRPGGRMPHAG
jgi:catechol 2,3-dioxygenase-like lactoylglutathione lyase family enzyme